FFPIRYPDGPRDAEALFVLPGGAVYIVSKGREGPATLFHYGVPDTAGAVRTVEPVQELTAGIAQLPDLITAAAATPDGRWVVVRTYTNLQLYRARDGRIEPVLDSAGIDLRPLAEFQGEGADIRADGTIFLASERGLETNPPPP